MESHRGTEGNRRKPIGKPQGNPKENNGITIRDIRKTFKQPQENLRKTVRKPKENHRITMGKTIATPQETIDAKIEHHRETNGKP